MIVGLMGFEFKSANKGCEALVYSFLSIILEKVEKIEYIYNFSGSELGKVPEYFRGLNFKNITPKLKDLRFRYIRALKKCDVIFDVTMGDSFSDIYSQNYYNYLMRHKRVAGLLCKKYILLPQTYGPFEYAESERKAKKVLSRAYKIYCRDEMSAKFLEDKFGINNSVLVSDMALILPYDTVMYQFPRKEKIGVNVSGLLYKGGFHSKNQFGLSLNYRELIDRLLITLVEKSEVYLIPHVIDLADDAYDDDYKICKLLHEKYPTTVLAPAFDTPIQAKSYISNMDVFIGSRMHSTIASFSSGVVTIPISYSRKFEGLFGSLNYPFIVNAKAETTESAYEMVMKFIDQKKELFENQIISLNIIKKKNIAFKKSIVKIMEGV